MANVSALQLGTLETRACGILEFLPSLRNLLQPVNRLPPEILSRVTRCFLDQDARDARSIIPLTHMCRYWRESITSAPEKLTLVSDGRIELAKLSLERAKAARLDVTIDIHRLGAESFGLIADYTKNIDTLRVQNLSGRKELTAAVANFPRSNPNLQSLTLLCAYTSAKWDQSVHPFKSLSPTLTCLSLFNVPLYPSLRKLRLLTDLTLHYHRFDLNLEHPIGFLGAQLFTRKCNPRHSVHGTRPPEFTTSRASPEPTPAPLDIFQQPDERPSAHLQNSTSKRCTSTNFLA